MARTRLSQQQITSNLLGIVQATANFSTASTTDVQATSMSISIVAPSDGPRLRIRLWAIDNYQTAAGGSTRASIWDGTVGTGTQLSWSAGTGTANSGMACTCEAIVQPAGGSSKTYNVGFHAGAGTAFLEAASTFPTVFTVERM